MSSGNCTTEYTRLEIAADDAVIERAGLIRNSVLRRALGIAAKEYATLRAGGGEFPANADVAVMVAWVMQASDEVMKVEVRNGEV